MLPISARRVANAAVTNVSGLPIDAFDAQIASICRTHAAALATCNVKDFQDTEVDLIDPWNDV